MQQHIPQYGNMTSTMHVPQGYEGIGREHRSSRLLRDYSSHKPLLVHHERLKRSSFIIDFSMLQKCTMVQKTCDSSLITESLQPESNWWPTGYLYVQCSWVWYQLHHKGEATSACRGLAFKFCRMLYAWYPRHNLIPLRYHEVTSVTQDGIWRYEKG